MLKEQIEACHKRNIRVPIYTTIQWDHYTAEEHPEWLRVSPEGWKPFTPGFYRSLCLNSPYRDFIKAHTEEILETLPVDGFFFDIVGPGDCCCKYCRAGMEAKGWDPSDSALRAKYGRELCNGFDLEMSALVRKYQPNASIFYNNGGVWPGNRGAVSAFSHLEFDAIPSSSINGYMNFPLMAAFTRTLGLEYMGMTGKFHTGWGDSHSFKNKVALQYECFQLLAVGARCSIGDQLHPSGKICRTSYELVGSAFAEVEKKEPWCKGTRAVSEIAILTPEEQGGGRNITLGVVALLHEAAQQYDIVDSFGDFPAYKVLILPDTIVMGEELARKVDDYVAGGGSVIASFESGMNARKTEFALKSLGVGFAGNGPIAPDGLPARGRKMAANAYADYVLPEGAIGKGLPQTEHVMYTNGVEIEAMPGTEVLANVILPYAYRTWRTFSSHGQTPSSGKADGPAIVRKGRAIYFRHAIFTQYNRNAPEWYKTLFLNALGILLPEPIVRHDGPTSMFVTVREQPAENRWIVHLLHYIAEQRSAEVAVVKDVIPLYGVKVAVRAPKKVKSAVCIPENQPLAFEEKNGRVEFMLPKLDGHQMIALEFN
jgi:hypothetical protein